MSDKPTCETCGRTSEGNVLVRGLASANEWGLWYCKIGHGCAIPEPPRQCHAQIVGYGPKLRLTYWTCLRSEHDANEPHKWPEDCTVIRLPRCDCGGVIVGSGGTQDYGGSHHGYVWGGNCTRCGKGYGENEDEPPRAPNPLDDTNFPKAAVLCGDEDNGVYCDRAEGHYGECCGSSRPNDTRLWTKTDGR